ncbi:amidohydrolase family protein [Sciscionella marina]|uniref:amidohydrolase family protein n=1 Tax=Sciscionella marina TaxID=508770 RepID=UPI000381A7C8|nr:amidohydrolase family protein [Sciscionella marina]
MKLIALEEAFWCDELSTEGTPMGHIPVKSEVLADWRRRLVDFTEYRLPEMDEHGVDMQVLSLTAPGVQGQPDSRIAVADARVANDFLATVVGEYPGRFQGLAAVALQDPHQAAVELRRAVTELGLCGALVNDHTLGHFLDEPQYVPFWEALQDLGVPLYVHPNPVPSDDWTVLQGHSGLDHATWGWNHRTGGHALRLIFGGVFDRFPGVRIILGHMGEFLPAQLFRIDTRYRDLEPEYQPPLKKLPSEYFGTNIAITTSGVFSSPALMDAIQMIGIDNVMFSIDYPYESTGQAVEFLRAAPLAMADKARIAHGNAERILRLNS